jgi:DNA-binding MarR family transcriptional regulator
MANTDKPTNINSFFYDDKDETVKLSPNEKKVLVGLIRYPSKKDTEICAILEMRKSTFSTIKSRLEEQKIYERISIPGFPKIGAELFCLTLARLSLRFNSEERLEYLQEVLTLFREDVFALGEAENMMLLTITKNFTDFDRNNQLLAQTGSEKNIFLRTALKYLVFPFETTHFIRFFSYAPLISNLFNIESPSDVDNDKIPENDSLIYEESLEKFKLSQTERKVFNGLLEFPDKSNRSLAEEINVSKNTLATIKKRYLEEQLVLPRIIPNLTKLGIKLMILFHGSFHSGTKISQRQLGIKKVDNTLNPILLLVKDLEFLILFATRNFEDYHAQITEVLHYFSEFSLVSDHEITFFSLPHARILKDHQYLPLVEKLFSRI